MTESNYDRIMVGVRLPPDRPETWKQYWRFPLYEVSDKGLHRRAGSGQPLSQRLNAPEPPWYWLLDFRPEGGGGKKKTVSGQVAVLETFTGERCPPGLQSLHGEYGPLVNWIENLSRGTGKANAAMKPVNGGGESNFPCINYGRLCRGMVRSEGRRCRPCLEREAVVITGMLNAGLPLDVVTARRGYENSDWVYRLATDRGLGGGWAGTKRDARLQQPTWRQRVAITLRDRQRNGWGDAA